MVKITAAKTEAKPKQARKATKPKTQKTVVVTAETPIEELPEDVLVDRAAALARKIKEVAETDGKKLDALIAEIRSRVGTRDKDKTVVLQGTTYNAEVSKVPEKTKITDLAKARELLGDDTFFEIASVGVGDLKKYLPGDDWPKVMETKQEGTRGVKFKEAGK